MKILDSSLFILPGCNISYSTRAGEARQGKILSQQGNNVRVQYFDDSSKTEWVALERIHTSNAQRPIEPRVGMKVHLEDKKFAKTKGTVRSVQGREVRIEYMDSKSSVKTAWVSSKNISEQIQEVVVLVDEKANEIELENLKKEKAARVAALRIEREKRVLLITQRKEEEKKRREEERIRREEEKRRQEEARVQLERERQEAAVEGEFRPLNPTDNSEEEGAEIWEEHHDENSGQLYYYNPVTGETKWQHEMVGLGLIHSELTTRDTEVVVEYEMNPELRDKFRELDI